MCGDGIDGEPTMRKIIRTVEALLSSGRHALAECVGMAPVAQWALNVASRERLLAHLLLRSFWTRIRYAVSALVEQKKYDW